ncbi:DUF4843 domain-containing protein [Sphingobacterium sp. SGG-5]|uniref:DUF4843 domain-containing protein n=1 Tax=Sphingobacterium sp. SGG-5 TaxID=2710881 RepID=UPI0013ED78F8|nr:DUF4843 domain-containing protein [Sphingobacterium sp. SGG-5]NGM61303.1 DUF4843 domain-containing protein [Sphingobacterium sp. SGG-5]
MRKLFYLAYSVLFLLTGCFKDFEERYLFEENRLEFNDAVLNGNASGRTYPILGPVPAADGNLIFQVNMTGKQVDHDRKFKFRVVADETTAVEGRDYRLLHGDEYTIPANSSFGQIEIEILPDGSGSPTIVLELLPTDDVKVMDRYHKIGSRFVYLLTIPDPSQLETVNDITVFKDFVIGSYSNQNIGYFADLSNYYVYTADGAEAGPENIDIVHLHGASTGANLLLPSYTRFDLWNVRDPRTWTHRNDGVLMRLPNPNPDELALFENATSVSDLLTAYGYYAATLSSRPGYSSTKDGPSARIQGIGAGDLIVYYSTERSIVTLFKVKAVDSGSAGSLTMEAKTGQFDPTEIVNSGALTIGGWYTGTCLVDLASIARYKETDLTPDMRNNIDFISLWSGSGQYLRFLSLHNTAIDVGGVGTTNRIRDNWSTAERNQGELIHYQNASEAEIQAVMNLTTRDQLIAAYESAKVDVMNRTGYNVDDHGPGAAVRRTDAGSIVFFKSNQPGRDLYAVILVNNITLGSSNGRETVDLFIKSNLK